MAVSFPIPAVSPGALSGFAAVGATAFRNLTASSSTASVSLAASVSSEVEVSALGQVLAAGQVLENSLQAVQRTDQTTATAAAAVSRAQDFVAAFNGLQNSLDNGRPLLATFSGSAAVDRFSLTLNAAATTAVTAGNAGGGRLQDIGIVLQPANPATGAVTLGVDRDVLGAAAAADPGRTLNVLAQATAPLLLQVSRFAAQAGATGGLADDAALPGSALETSLLRSLSADTVLNDVQLTDLDLAALGLDANTIRSADTVLRGSLTSGLLPPDTTTAPATLQETLVLTGANPALAATTAPVNSPPGPAAPAQAPPPGPTPPVAATPPPAVAPPTAAPAPAATTATVASATATADALAAERSANAATQALQRLVNDPTLRALSNNLFNPAYSALVAAAHQSDFISPSPTTRANALAGDVPGPVLPAERARAIAGYNEAAAGFVRYPLRDNR